MVDGVTEIEVALRRVVDEFKAASLLAPASLELASVQQAYQLSSYLNNGCGAMLGELSVEHRSMTVGGVLIRWPGTE